MRHERIVIATGSPWGLLRLLGWRGIAALAAGAALVLTLALLAGAIFLIVFPVALGAGLVARWLAGRRREEAAEFRIERWSRTEEVEPERIEILPPRRPR